MRIAQVAPVATRLPPSKSGSVELVTSLLTDGLVERGHKVTVFATGDSKTKADLHAVFPHGYMHDEEMYPWEFYEMVNLSAACERAGEFDIIHYQSRYYPMSIAFSRLVKTPMVQTVHLQPDECQMKLWKRYPDAKFVAISQYQARAMSDLNCVGAIHHGIDTSSFDFCPAPEDYLVFLGSLSRKKGVLQAVKVAKHLGIRLLIAGATDPFYAETVQPYVDARIIEYVGEVGHHEKNKLLGGAVAMLYPVQQGEPFGLVLVEAMACGTPVLAFQKGAVSEIVVNGLNGYFADSVGAMADLFPKVAELDRSAIRAYAVKHFDKMQMVDEHVKLYDNVINLRRQA